MTTYRNLIRHLNIEYYFDIPRFLVPYSSVLKLPSGFLGAYIIFSLTHYEQNCVFQVNHNLPVGF